jgi:hypothetical protein
LNRRDLLKQCFPGLKSHTFNITSQAVISYNCIAWAAEDDTRYWWPGVSPDPTRPYYWPGKHECTIDAFVEAFGTLGYKTCRGSGFDPQYQKVALYAINDEPTHMARQIDAKLWTSKLGDLEDISHALKGLDGKYYGMPVLFMRKEKVAKEAPPDPN